ncbi:hypothetical protein DFA_03385 [Cavenderia fasciculata]|uniref:GGDEF domain-containing protein n=1 Tax=Cavenderia fasciculata TaxID=261658 RepID=F4PHF4_CACFS|nr:uncharacterized protein DFA_03385 [Cavenderia fasciculata]EGG25138.1 hypothetical protein DFA_03385 [Cavenderia fasciculata]|eukprot:XP_004362989.1 hypothetical protein DFA_03385 [Cavenderia fasciculata]
MAIENIYFRYPMMGEALHRHNFAGFDSLTRFPTSLFPSNYFYMAFCIIVLLYTVHKREKKLTRSASHFMEILSLTPAITILEINFHKRIVKSTNPLSSNNNNNKSDLQSNEGFIFIEEFCQSHEIDPVVLHNMIASSMNPFTPSDIQIKCKNSSSNYRLSGKYRLNNKIEKFCNKSSSDLCSIFFIDLNHFKQINDTYGHDNGDVVLKSVANRFQQLADESVLPVRLSGDEFLIVKRNVESTEHANQFIDGFLSSVSSDCINLTNETNIKVSLSFGGVVFTKSQSTSTEKLIKCADERMYQMKKNLLPKEQVTVNFTDL